jgi:hypothetical protein
MQHQGSCHCGNIKFEFNGAVDSAISCNCSICSRNGALLTFVKGNDFKLLTPREAMSTYTFNKHVIEHHFCPSCGIEPFGEGKDPQGVATAAINLRCVDGVDLEALTIHKYDGRSA